MAGKEIPLGPSGETVRQNVARLRQERGLSYAELSRRLGEAGRPIAPLGLRRIESGERRVDVDDLMALAITLWVDVPQLLLPPVYSTEVSCRLTGFGDISTAAAWNWLTARGTVPTPRGESQYRRLQFRDSQAPREVLTGEERYLRRERWLENRISELEGAASMADAQAAEDWRDGGSSSAARASARINETIKELQAIDPSDEMYWRAEAEYDPAPPGEQTRRAIYFGSIDDPEVLRRQHSHTLNRWLETTAKAQDTPLEMIRRHVLDDARRLAADLVDLRFRMARQDPPMDLPELPEELTWVDKRLEESLAADQAGTGVNDA